MSDLNVIGLESVNQLCWPEKASEITEESSALEVFTDFEKTKPLVLDSSTLAGETEKHMQQAHVRLKLVVDKQNQFLGLVSLDDVNTQEIIKRVNSGYDREELKVTDFMTPRSSLKAFVYKDLEKAKIKDIVKALKNNGQQHFPVMDNDCKRIRGIISASDVSRKLGLPIDLARESNFYAIYKELFSHF